ncbi:hypothetical protein [Mesorhizobium sp. YR577]|uniref:hypothetical protein n=1 Tax=Mesorhizobium sp. YR577 TaxID=1884373 RepID=UPI0008ED62C1|nr:hypothetical protein [Mesorhizobium sp. YR577]SFU15726.1 hypothetical protein SAMN05518861_11659 [Mesorhizobium sp. YR577]
MLKRPEPGQVSVVSKIGDNVELLHLANNREMAELWLAKAGYSRARLEDVRAVTGVGRPSSATEAQSHVA